MMAMRYGGLDKGLTRTPTYRVSTISQNQIIDVPTIDNDLTSGLHNIDSYYSLQNQYLGNFSTSLQNNQYQANVPLRQVDDRTVLNNFWVLSTCLSKVIVKMQPRFLLAISWINHLRRLLITILVNRAISKIKKTLFLRKQTVISQTMLSH